jgi:hypothetical protein
LRTTERGSLSPIRELISITLEKSTVSRNIYLTVAKAPSQRTLVRKNDVANCFMIRLECQATLQYSEIKREYLF